MIIRLPKRVERISADMHICDLHLRDLWDEGMTIMVRFAVCDDEREMVQCISDKLRTYYPDECEIKTYFDGASLLSNYFRDYFDAIFLDIGLPGLNGLEIAEKIRESDLRVKIIFVSNQNDLAYKGYLYDAFRFVRKSNLEQELCEAATSLYDALFFQNEYFIFKTDKGEIIRVAKDIIFFEANGHYMKMVCKDKAVNTFGTLRNFEERLRNIGFIRIHKSFLVNFKYIHSVDNDAVVLTNGERLPLSRKRANETKSKMRLFSSNIEIK